MPPITDPMALAQIQQQQQIGGQPPDPYYTAPMPKPQPFPSALPPLSNRMGRKTDIEIKSAIDTNNRQSALLPGQLDNQKLDAEAKRLQIRKDRLAQGLDPDTGKPMTGPNAGKLGEDALEGLSDGEKNIVKGITQGRVPVSSFALARNPTLMKYIQLAYQYEPGTDLTTFQRRQAAATKFLSNPNSPMVRVNQALQHLDRFYDSAHKLNNFHNGGLLNPFPQVGNLARAGAMSLNSDPRFKAFETDRDALATELAAAFQGSGQSALADREHWRDVLKAAQSPESFDAAIKEAVGLLGGRVEASQEQFKQAVGANADKFDLMSPKAREVYEKYSADTFGASAEKEDKKLDPNAKGFELPKGYQDEHAEFLVNHPPGKLTVEDYVKMRHDLDAKYLTGKGQSVLDPDQVKKLVDYYNQHGISPHTKVPTGTLPTSELEKGAIEGAISGPGVGFANAANALTLGLPELVAGEGGRSAMHHSNEEHPVWAGAGEIAGSIAPIGGGEKLAMEALTRVIPKSSRSRLAADVIANSLYQGERGFADADNGEGGSGFMKGLAAGAGGAVAGNAVTKGVTPLLSKGTQEALKALGGTDLSTFQRLGMGKVESTFSGAPGAHGAQVKALVSFNRNNAGRTLDLLPEGLPGVSKKLPKGIKTGTELNDFVHTQLSNAYEAVKPKIAGSVDGGYANAIGALKVSAGKKGPKADAFKEIETALSKFSGGGKYTGEGYVEASEKLRAIVQDYATIAENGGRHDLTPSAAREISRLAESARKQMQSQIARGDPVLGQQLKGIERAYAKKMVAEDATNRALSNEGVYSPDQALTSMKKLDTSANQGRSARGNAFDQPYLGAASKIMGSTVPKKLSPQATAIVLGAIGLGGTYGADKHPYIAGALGMMAAGAYGPGLKRIVQKALTGKRPTAVDNFLIRRAIEAGIGANLQGHLPEEGSQ